eukprot:766212-Hanusia_phi.AAC.5
MPDCAEALLHRANGQVATLSAIVTRARSRAVPRPNPEHKGKPTAPQVHDAAHARPPHRRLPGRNTMMTVHSSHLPLDGTQQRQAPEGPKAQAHDAVHMITPATDAVQEDLGAGHLTPQEGEQEGAQR